MSPEQGTEAGGRLESRPPAHFGDTELVGAARSPDRPPAAENLDGDAHRGCRYFRRGANADLLEFPESTGLRTRPLPSRARTQLRIRANSRNSSHSSLKKCTVTLLSST
jgi:hypothetical protein